ncbi:hypothetical protein ACIGW7_20520 [Streptomyces sp. NPDC053253]|uniref:hypothetical protein n=1 Tax=Streptomyces sp. NPDC053253 TaxID=3365699 RepID=UPI0037D57B9B
MRVNHTYGRGGALAYPAAYDVHQAKVFGRCEPSTGIGPFMNRVTQVMSQEPYASAKRVLWIVDNGSSHRGKAAAARLTTAFPNAVPVHTPVRASRLNLEAGRRPRQVLRAECGADGRGLLLGEHAAFEEGEDGQDASA